VRAWLWRTLSVLGLLLTSGSVKVFGCRPTKMTPRTPGPAYANLQRRKPREGIRQTVRRALSKMVSRVISIRSREFSKNLGFEYVYNFGVMARVLLTGESRFLSSCDFKELRVIKRARFTTLTLAASQHSFCSIARTEGLKKLRRVQTETVSICWSR